MTRVGARSATTGDRFRAAAAAARGRNAIELGVHPTPPTITSGSASLDAGLTRDYRYTTSPNAGRYRITGGIPIPNSVNITAWSVTRPSGSGGNTHGNPSKQTYGWAIEFVTDAPRVQIRSQGASAGWMVEVDGRPVAAAPLARITSGLSYYLLDFGTRAARHIRLEFLNAVSFLSADIGPLDSLWAPASETNIRVASVGDSVTAGSSGAQPNGSFQHVAGKLLGWADVRQVSYGSTGFAVSGTTNTFGDALRVADAVAHAPDLLMIHATGNDNGQAGVQAAALNTFRAYRLALPQVPIVVTGVDTFLGATPLATQQATEAAVKAAFDSWADGNAWWLPIYTHPVTPWLSGSGTAAAPNGTGNADLYAADAAHPSDAGHAYLGRRLAAAFSADVLPHLI